MKDVVNLVTGEEKVEKARKVPAEAKHFLVMFQQNRSFDLVIGIEGFCFAPHGTLRMAERHINHPDFKSVAHFFSVTEVGEA